MYQIALCRPYNKAEIINKRCPSSNRTLFIIHALSAIIVQSPPFIHLIAE